MKAFMDKEFMLQSPTAQHLYHDYAADMPICDYHCHIPPREIYENRRFENIAQVWLGGRNPDGSYFGDHYKWRVMRSNGVPEEYITGDKPDRERFQKFAEALPMAIGNPMYHWTNLELHVFFGYDGVLNGDTAEEVWNLCNDKLQHDPKLTVRGLIEQSNVAFIGTTDDPIDDLYWHKKIKEDPTIKFTVAPSFRPDKAININKPGFAEYMGKLAAVVGKEKLACIDCVTDALTKRIEFFAEMGCRASDHGLDYIPYREATKEEVNAIYQKVMAGETCTVEEAEKYQTYILIHLGKQYHRLGIAMQIHYNCLRGVNRKMNALLGPDTGYDMINTATCGGEIASPAERPERHRRVPQDHHLQPEPRRRRSRSAPFWAASRTARCRARSSTDPHGGSMTTRSAWKSQMTRLASLGLLGNFVGMLTDSRSFLSYTRHDYFRRILCNIIGQWVEDGEYPNDEKALEKIVKGICFDNAKRYFAL